MKWEVGNCCLRGKNDRDLSKIGQSYLLISITIFSSIDAYHTQSQLYYLQPPLQENLAFYCSNTFTEPHFSHQLQVLFDFFIKSRVIYQISYNILMLKKNSQKRFHTAGARIALSNKLPSDFFPLNLHEKATKIHRSQPHRLEKLQHSPSSSHKKALNFTFHRSSSHNKLQILYRHSQGDENRASLSNNYSKISNKLPPVRLSIEKQNIFYRDPRDTKLQKVRNKNVKINDWMREGQRSSLKL